MLQASQGNSFTIYIDSDEARDRQLAEHIIQLTMAKYGQYIHTIEHHPELGRIKVDSIDKERYGTYLYWLTKELSGTPDLSNRLRTDFELASLIDSCFDPFALKQDILAIQDLELMKILHEVIIDNHPVNPVPHHTMANVNRINRETLKSIILNKAREQYIQNIASKLNTQANQQPVTVFADTFIPIIPTVAPTVQQQARLEYDRIVSRVEIPDAEYKQYQKDLALIVARLMYTKSQNTLKSVGSCNYRFLSNIIILDTVMVLSLSAFGGFKYYNNAIIGPAYLLAFPTSDIITQLLVKTFWSKKPNHLWITANSAANAALALSSPWIAHDQGLWQRVVATTLIFCTITSFDMVLVLSPLFSKLFNKQRWFVDDYDYQKAESGRIWMAAALLAIMPALISIFDYAKAPLDTNNYSYFGGWATAAVVSQLAIFLHWAVIGSPRYAKRCEQEQALTGFFPLSFQSVFKNGSMLNIISERVWAILGVVIVYVALADIQHIYPEQQWISIVNAAAVVFLGPRLGAFTQRLLAANYCRGSLSSRDEQKYLNYLLENYHDSFDASTLLRLDNHRQYGRSIAQKVQTTVLTAQTHRKRLGYEYYDLSSSITSIALYIVLTFYFNQLNLFNDDSWGYFGVHLGISLLVATGIVLLQYAIANLSKVETALIESTGIPTRIFNGIKGLLTNSNSSIADNVFIKQQTPGERRIKQAVQQEQPSCIKRTFGFLFGASNQRQVAAATTIQEVAPSIVTLSPPVQTRQTEPLPGPIPSLITVQLPTDSYRGVYETYVPSPMSP